MSEEREILELAAKAAGYTVVGLARAMIAQGVSDHALIVRNERGGESVFDPLTDDGDALRLSVACNLWPRLHNRDMPLPYIEYVHVVVYREETGATALSEVTIHERTNEARAAATRRAIVEAAASVGERMQNV